MPLQEPRLTANEGGSAILLESIELSVEFGAQRALDGVCFDLRAGEIVGLVGPNGAGKSTFGRVLVGEIPCGNFTGELRFRGLVACFANTREAHQAGVALIHQEGAAVEALSIGENVMLTLEPSRHGIINWPALHQQAALGLKKLSLSTDTHRLLGEHGGVALMELVEVARSIVRGGSVFVFDESTAALGAEEARALLGRMRELASSGAGVIFISHRIDEILALCQRIVVLRDGRKVFDAPRCDCDHASIINAMLGDRLGAMRSAPTARRLSSQSGELGRAALRLRNWCVAKSDRSRVDVGPLDFEVRHGEILGLFGALGSGKTELLHSLYGLAFGLCSGECWIDGAWHRPFASPDAAIRRNLALVPAERQRDGIVPQLSVLENMMLGYRRANLAWGGMLLRHSQAVGVCERLIKELGIRTSGPQQPIGALSGGNQQKILLARAMLNSPTILLLDEPTRGIDVGAKEDVYRWVRAAAASGAAIIVSSLEEAELLGLADRILILRDGQQVAVLNAEDTSEHELLILTAGGGGQ
jgi:ABC-type sugar transport system ATPase subunit